MALEKLTTYAAANKDSARLTHESLMILRGTGTNDLYVMEVDPATGAIPVSASLSGTALDYGVSSAALRTAAQIGNAAGAAAFGAGANGADVLRTTPATDAPHLLATRHEDKTTPLAARFGNGSDWAAFGAGASGADVLRTTPATDAPHLLATRHETVSTPLAARFGNGSDWAAFGAGASGADVLRTTPATDAPHLLAVRHEAAATPLASRLSNGTNFSAYGAGAVGADVLRTTPASDSPHLLATRHEAAATPLAAQISNGANFAAFGAGANAAEVIRTTPATDAPHLLATRHETGSTPLAARLSNGAGFSAYGAGANGADVLRTTPATDAPHLLATRHETVSTPLASRLSDGTDFITAVALAASQHTQATITKMLATLGIAMGWDGTTHREIATDTSGHIKTAVQTAAGRAVAELATNDYDGTPVTTAAYVELVASTAAGINRLHVFDSSGSAMILATGAAASETDLFYIPPGGSDSPFDVAIPAGTRLSLKALDQNATVGRLILTGLS